MGNYQQSEPMPHKTPMKTPLKMNGIIRDPERLELNLNLQDGSTVRRNVKGVKLVGMDSSNTLRRTSLHVCIPFIFYFNKNWQHSDLIGY